jgi:hypothetical protein
LTLYKINVSNLGYREIGFIRDLIDLYFNSDHESFFIKQFAFNDNTAHVFIIDDNNNYWHQTEENKIEKMTKEEKINENWKK